MKKLDKRISPTQLLTEVTSEIGIHDSKTLKNLVTVSLAMLTKVI